MNQDQADSKPRILVMDDDPTLCDMLRFMLRMLGYDTEVAGDGAAALAAYRRAQEAGRPFAAVILDLTVRDGMGGQETVGKLRELDPAVKAIVSSGHAGNPVTEECEKYGFCAAVVKPFSIDRMEATLAEVLNASGNE